jgi:hypothetical protein
MILPKNKWFIPLFLLALTISGVSCIKDLRHSMEELEKVKQIRFNPEYALPLVNSSLSLSDLVKRVNSDLIYEDDNRLLHVVYKGEIVTIAAEDFVDIEDQVTNFSLGLSQVQVDQFNNSGSLDISLGGVVNYNLFDIEVDSMLTKLCRNLVTISSDLQHNVSVVVNFPDVKKAGQSYTMNVDANYVGTLPVKASIGNDLKKYLFDMTRANKAFNQLKIQFDIKITNTGGAAATTQDSIRLKSGFYFNEFETLWGYVGKSDISPAADTISLGFFNSSDKGSFTISDPRVKLYIYNSFGIPIEAKVEKLGAYYPTKGFIDVTGIPSPLPIPVLTIADMGKILVDSIVLNSSNSNFATLINDRPHRLDFDFDVQVNPQGSSGARNFMMDTSKMRFAIDVDVPLDGTASNFGLESEQEFELEIESIDELDYAIIRISLENEFPIEFAFQVVFLDSAGTGIDSLIDETNLVIESGIVDANGEIIAPGKSVHDFKIDQDRLDNMSKAKKIKIRARVTTPSFNGSQVPVKFYSHNKLDFKMGVQLKAKIDEPIN